MDRVNQPLADPQVDAFMLRVDKNADGLIRYSEFLEVFYSTEVKYAEEKIQSSPSKTRGNIFPQSSEKSQPYINQLRDAYTSPRKQYTSPTKMLNPVESFCSPASTKASFNSTSLYKTPTKRTPIKPVYEDYEDLATSVSQAGQPKTSTFVVNFTPKRESPMKPKEELELVKALKEMVEHIRALEVMKNNLALKKDFNSYNAFAVFDAERRGSVNTSQLEQGLKRLNLNYTKADVTLLVKRLDTDLDGQVRFEDFSHFITPKSAEFAKLFGSREPYYISDLANVLGAFSEETLVEFKEFVKALIEEETLCESIRQRLVKRKAFNLHDAFKAIDRYDNGFITAEHFKDLLEENGLFYSQKDVNTLVERYAKATRGKVSYYDFIREMTPKSVQKY